MKRQIILFVASFIGDYMEKNIFVCVLMVVAVCGILYWLKPTKLVQAEEQKVGNSEYGVVYINPDTVEAVKRDNAYYLIVSAEEIYTDEKFLQQLRQGEDLQNAVSALDLYMFTNDGRFYCTPQRYIIDKDNNVCADLGGDMQMAAVDEKIISDIYVSALKILENNQRFQSMILK